MTRDEPTNTTGVAHEDSFESVQVEFVLGETRRVTMALASDNFDAAGRLALTTKQVDASRGLDVRGGWMSWSEKTFVP